MLRVKQLTNSALHLPWRAFLRCRRLGKSYTKLGFWPLLKLIITDLLLNPIATFLHLNNIKMKFAVHGYKGYFLVRLATTDTKCFVEVILEDEYNTVVHLADPNLKLIVDAGANVGFSVRYFGRLFPAATIIVIEPDSENMAMCKEQISIGNHGDLHVVYVECCIAAESRLVSLDRSDGAWAARMVEGRAGEQIAAKTMGEILLECGLNGQNIGLLKCDIEGAESELFRLSNAWHNQLDCIVVETHAPYYASSFIADLMSISPNFNVIQEDELVSARRR